VREERDHVVPRLLLDLEDARRVQLASRGLADLRGSAGRDRARAFHRLAHRELDREPLLEAVTVVPQRRELWPAIARDHFAP